MQDITISFAVQGKNNGAQWSKSSITFKNVVKVLFVGYGPDEGKYGFTVTPCYKGQDVIDTSKGESTFIEHNEYFERFVYDGNRPYDHTLVMNAIDATHSLTVTAIFGQVNFIVNY